MLLSLSLLDGLKYDLDLGIELGSGSHGGIHQKIIFYADYVVLRCLMLKKDLNPIYLRWYLLLQ